METFKKKILEEGSGATPKKGQTATVSADLFLATTSGARGNAIWSTHKPSGFLFSATNGPDPFSYRVFSGSVITGWDEGVATMKVGETAELFVPWKYGYGESGHATFQIPPRTDLIFEIKLLGLK